MDIFNVLTMIGGLCLFLFGMNLMGQALERRAGGKLRSLLDKMTGSVFAGFLTGLGITAIIQSSSATTVMVVGFVNSGLMTLRQAINVIMGANVGTTVTAWLLSLGGIDSGNFWIKLLKPSSFTPVLALIGIIYYMFCKDNKKKDTGMILLGFATLMFGMETMSGAVAGLKDVPAFTNLFVAFQNPLLGVLAGALLTAIIQFELRVRRYFAGARRHGLGELCRGHSHHHGPEHRHDRHGHAVVHRHEQKRPPRRGRSPSLQCHRRCRAADGLLHCARGFCARAAG